MENKKRDRKLVRIALIWAAVMIVVSYLLKDSEKSATLLMFLIGGWIATGGLTGKANDFAKAECRAFRRLIGKAPKAES